MSLRAWALAAILAAILWFNLLQDGSAGAFAQRSLDLVDPRPARSILIIGNSRTFFNDMPKMLRKIADSAGSQTKFQIETNAKPGFTFERHWRDGRTRRLLGEGWDDVILQGASGELSDEPAKESFLSHGTKLAGIAKVNGGVPRLVVNWTYDPTLYQYSEDRTRHLEKIVSGHVELAQQTGMRRINLAGLWEAVRLSHPSIKLTTDGNHPTLAGSYLYALAIYAHLSNGPARDVTFVPDGLDPSHAEALRQTVDGYPLLLS